MARRSGKMRRGSSTTPAVPSVIDRIMDLEDSSLLDVLDHVLTKGVMATGDQQQIFVRAIRSDGTLEDVTSTAQFNTLNDAVAAVSPAGLVTAKDRGETAIMVRFMGQATVAHITLPYATPGTNTPGSPKAGELFAGKLIGRSWGDESRTSARILRQPRAQRQTSVTKPTAQMPARTAAITFG